MPETRPRIAVLVDHIESDYHVEVPLEREETLVLEPLEFAGTPVGIAAFAWGARNPVHYEVLREVLSAAVHALNQTK